LLSNEINAFYLDTYFREIRTPACTGISGDFPYDLSPDTYSAPSHGALTHEDAACTGISGDFPYDLSPDTYRAPSHGALTHEDAACTGISGDFPYDLSPDTYRATCPRRAHT
jgi:hypothetical protein